MVTYPSCHVLHIKDVGFNPLPCTLKVEGLGLYLGYMHNLGVRSFAPLLPFRMMILIS